MSRVLLILNRILPVGPRYFFGVIIVSIFFAFGGDNSTLSLEYVWTINSDLNDLRLYLILGLLVGMLTLNIIAIKSGVVSEVDEETPILLDTIWAGVLEQPYFNWLCVYICSCIFSVAFSFHQDIVLILSVSIVSLYFAVLHINPESSLAYKIVRFVGTAGFSMALGMICYTQGMIVACIVHWGYDTLALILDRSLDEEEVVPG